MANALPRTLAEKIGAGVLIVGVTLAGYAARIFQEPKTAWVAGEVVGIIVAAAGLLIWFLGVRFSRRTRTDSSPRDSAPRLR